MMIRSPFIRLYGVRIPGVLAQSANIKVRHHLHTTNRCDDDSFGSSLLPFNIRRHGENFGQLVRNEEYHKVNQLEDKWDYVKKPESVTSPFRNEDGSFVKGTTSEEARLDKATIEGRTSHSVIKLPREISLAINKQILHSVAPNKLRERVAELYQSLSKSQIHKSPESGVDCDAHIAALFLQDYAHCFQVLSELQKRVPNFNPTKVLDIGYGPATGMIALNHLMGDSFSPESEAYILGKNCGEMKKRAEVLLRQQQCEKVSATDSKSKCRTKLRDSLPTSQYDLIIVNCSLLTRAHIFQRDVETNIRTILKLLAPGGHLVLVERGNYLGFETIARARQVMLRPESHPVEIGKVPRLYRGGFRGQLKVLTTELEQTILEKYGSVSEQDLEFEFERDENFDLIELNKQAVANQTGKYGNEGPDADYHLKVIAPCPHHNKCPLQLGDPKYYRISSHKHRLSFCAFQKTVERPKYTMELKKGKRLAVPWDKSAADGFGFDKLSKNKLKLLEGSGRPGGGNSETGSFSYLIVERLQIGLQPQVLQPNLHPEVAHSHLQEIEPSVDSSKAASIDPSLWPRIINNVSKNKSNVKFDVCASNGNIETWQVPRSFGKQAYHDAKKVSTGDLWPLGRKSAVAKNRISDSSLRKLDMLSKAQKKKSFNSKSEHKRIVSRAIEDFE